MTTPQVNAGEAGRSVVRLPSGSVTVAGHLELDITSVGVRPLRVPRHRWHQFPPGAHSLWTVMSQASGVRVELATSATSLTLRAHFTRVDFGDLAGRVNDVGVDVDGVRFSTAAVTATGHVTVPLDGSDVAVSDTGAVSNVAVQGLPPGHKVVTLWLPQSMIVDLVDVIADAPVAPVDGTSPRWIHHGSSISHCNEADDPRDVWPVVAASAAGLDLINLGFGGQCMLDPFVARAIAATRADVISIKVGINIVGARSMDQRTFVPALHGFLDIIREQQPDTPIILASSILWPGNEDRPGPSDIEFLEGGALRCFAYGDPADIAKGALTLAASRDHVRTVVEGRAAGGDDISYLDGRTLFGPNDVDEFPLPDGLHPDAALYREMGARFASAAFGNTGMVPLGTWE